MNDNKNLILQLKTQLREAKDKRQFQNQNNRDKSPNYIKLIDENKMLNNMIKELNQKNIDLSNQINNNSIK